MPGVTLGDLPLELLVKIITFLPAGELCGLAQTNRSWERVTREERLKCNRMVNLTRYNVEVWMGRGVDPWMGLPEGQKRVRLLHALEPEVYAEALGIGMEEVMSDALLGRGGEGVFRLPPAVQSLEVVFLLGYNDCPLFRLVVEEVHRRCPRLAELSILFRSSAFDEEYTIHLDGLEHLRRFSLKLRELDGHLVGLGRMPQSLEALQICALGMMSVGRVQQLGQALGGLRELDLNVCESGSFAALLEVLSRSTGLQLRTLWIEEERRRRVPEVVAIEERDALHSALGKIAEMQSALPIEAIHLKRVAGWDGEMTPKALHRCWGEDLRSLSLEMFEECHFPLRPWASLNVLSLDHIGEISIPEPEGGVVFPQVSRLEMRFLREMRGVSGDLDQFWKARHVRLAGSVSLGIVEGVIRHDLDSLECIFLGEPTAREVMEVLRGRRIGRVYATTEPDGGPMREEPHMFGTTKEYSNVGEIIRVFE